jgi:hypothetical protein
VDIIGTFAAKGENVRWKPEEEDDWKEPFLFVFPTFVSVYFACM